jgi:hypothetical protein
MGVTRNNLLTELRRVADVVDRSPTEEDMLNHGAYAYSTYFRYFESWTRAKELAGIPSISPNRITDEELLSELKRIEKCVHGSPTRRDIDEMGDFPSSTYKYRFGPWNNALRKAELPLNEPSPNEGTSEYGPDWSAYRKRALDRDNEECRVCGVANSEVNPSLHVQHITPLREFEDESGSIDFEVAHGLDNLISLCPSCHKTYENRYTSCDPEAFAQSDRKERDS